ncbi:MAG: hypothetical protein ABWZ83_04655, partial [Mesorhizobium sp.]
GPSRAGATRAGNEGVPQSLLCSILALLDPTRFPRLPRRVFCRPVGAEANLALSTIYRINGGADTPGNMPTTVANGSTTVEVDLTATKAAGLFPAGAYPAQVVLRCE